jgi:precorrin-6B methylase 2
MTSTGQSPTPKIRNAVAATSRFVSELLFERRYGVKTSGRLVLAEHDEESINYVPIGWRRLRQALPTDSVTERDVFIDIGSGMGRAVLEAAAFYPFGRVIGVELSEQLHSIAEQNFAQTTRRLRCRNIELVNTDVREYRLPDDVTVVFINNSVRGSILAGVLKEISASVARKPRGVRLIYASPLEADAVTATGDWTRVRTIQPRRSHWPHGVTFIYEFTAQPSGATGDSAMTSDRQA